MKDKEFIISSTEITNLSNELTYRGYILSKDHVRKIFQKLNKPEYIALHFIREAEEEYSIYAGRTYVRELAEKMQVPVRRISGIVGRLKESGHIVWTHDGDGSDGTYVTITEAGKKLLAEEEMNLKEYYGKVIEKFGKDNLVQMLQLMKQLENVMSTEIEEEEEDNIDEE